MSEFTMDQTIAFARGWLARARGVQTTQEEPFLDGSDLDEHYWMGVHMFQEEPGQMVRVRVVVEPADAEEDGLAGARVVAYCLCALSGGAVALLGVMAARMMGAG